MPARSSVTESNDAAHRRAARVVERRDSLDVSCFCCGMAATGSAPSCPSGCFVPGGEAHLSLVFEVPCIPEAGRA